MTRAHLEEDAGKSLHDDYQGQTGIDLNRAGTPLLEIVSEPDMRSGAEACEYAKTLHALVMWLGICDGNMQEGSFRCDVNVSVRKPGEPYGTRREIKNLNSFKQPGAGGGFRGATGRSTSLEDGLQDPAGDRAVQPRHGRDPRDAQQGRFAADYRYFPDPDLPPLVIGARVDRACAQPRLPELPAVMAARFESRGRLAGL